MNGRNDGKDTACAVPVTGGRRDRFRLRFAEAADAPGLLRIYESGDFDGGISVLYARRPDPFRSLETDGDGAVIVVAEECATGVLIGMGACILRRGVVDAAGRIGTTGYLTGMKVLPEYRRRAPLMRDAYRMIRERTGGIVDVYYTTILDDNHAVSTMLEKPRAGMPVYRPAGHYETLFLRAGGLFGGGGQSRHDNYSGGGRYRQSDDSSGCGNGDDTVRWMLPDGCLLERGTCEDASTDDGWNRGAGSARDIPARLSAVQPPLLLAPENLDLPGLADRDVFVLRNAHGEAIAGCAVWNRQAVKQYVVTRYAGGYRLLRHLPMGLLGLPDLPEPNTTANCAGIVGLTSRNGDPAIAARLVRLVAARCGEYGFLMLGMCESHPLWPVTRRLRGIRYGSRLYGVEWPEAGETSGMRDGNALWGLASGVGVDLPVGFL